MILFQSWTFSNTSTDFIPNKDTITRHRRGYPKVIINVGGERHEIMWKLLEAKPLSRNVSCICTATVLCIIVVGLLYSLNRLGKLARAKTHESILELCEAYSLEKNEIYFDRDPHLFNSILNYYRKVLHMVKYYLLLCWSGLKNYMFWRACA